MTENEKDPRERAARALCRLYGIRPDEQLRGEPAWRSYLVDVDAVLAAIGTETGTLIIANDNRDDATFK